MNKARQSMVWFVVEINMSGLQFVFGKVDKLKEAANLIKNKFQPDQLDKKLTEAVSEQNWQASTQLLHQIANASYNYEHQQRVIAFIWDKLKNKSWKKVLKTLHLVDFLLKYGPMTLIDNLKENVYEFRKLDDYTAKSDGIDRGQSIRKQAKAVLVLLTDDQLLQDERAKAKQIKDRMSSVIGSGAYFGGFTNNSNTNSSEGPSNKGSGYGSISSESYKYSGPAQNTGMTFGQSVMRELQEKKKPMTTTTTSPQQPKGPSPKLNLNTMLEKKAEKEKKPQQSKKSFNNLAAKLVKPPEKKKNVESPVEPVTKKTSSSSKEAQQNPAKIDIMDFDFNAASQPQAPAAKSDPFDLLGGSQPQSQPQNFQSLDFLGGQASNTSPQISHGSPKEDSSALLFGGGSFGPQSNHSQLPLQDNKNRTGQAYSEPFNFGMSGNGNTGNHFSGSSLMGPQTNNYSNNNWGQQGLPAQNQSLNLSLNIKQDKGEERKDKNSLIDFSNFRQQIGSIPAENNKESIASNWNW